MTKKATIKKSHKLGCITVVSGILAGMQFAVEDFTPVSKGCKKVKYCAPNNGPRVIVNHIQVGGKFREADKAEDVRIAFSKLIAANIRWSAKSGYSDKLSGNPLRWDRGLARFVPA